MERAGTDGEDSPPAGEARTRGANDADGGGTGGQSSILIPCEDRYEAQKLASLILVRDPDAKDFRTFIDAVANIVGNEVIISLADGSSHSILLQDEEAADAFADFVQSVTEKKDKLLAAVTCAPHYGVSNHSDDSASVPESDAHSAVRISKGPR